MATYGLQIDASVYRSRRDLIGGVETSAAGNVVLRIGKEHDGGGWEQTAHVVLTRDEALALGDEMYALIGGLQKTT